MHPIVIECDPARGWNVRVPGEGRECIRAATRHAAEGLARQYQDCVRAQEIVVRDAYHRVLRVRAAG